MNHFTQVYSICTRCYSTTYSPTQPHNHIWHGSQLQPQHAQLVNTHHSHRYVLEIRFFKNLCWKKELRVHVLKSRSQRKLWGTSLSQWPRDKAEWDKFGKMPYSTQSGTQALCLFPMHFHEKQPCLYLIFLVLPSIQAPRVAASL